MSSANPEKWHEVKEIFYAALRRTPEEREQFLDEACRGDDRLRREVESLLAASESAGSFMQSPAVGEVAETIDAEKLKLRVNENISHYKILKLLGAGGMGEVYLAEDDRLDRLVAVKILSAEVSRDEANLRRFVREAKSASALNHPNILIIHEIGESGERPFIVSEFVEGATLRDVCKNKTSPLAEVLDISIQIANALTAAHTAHIVHRDIKPENIMIRPDGFVKILDFGLAKLVERKIIGSEDATAKPSETAKGLILGTINYMSPEQSRGGKIDERTDIFSLGLVIYEMIAGRTPFAGDSISETLANLINAEPPPLARFSRDVPDELQRIVSKMLRKNADERYQTMKDVLNDLKDLRRESEFQSKPERTNPPLQEEAKTQIVNAATTDNSPSETSGANSAKVKNKNYKLPIALAVLLCAAIGFGYWFFAERNAKQIESIAVMPFVNESGNADVEYLSDGMTETLISSLSQIPKLNVKARSSVFRYKGDETNLPKIAKELNVQAILTGRVIQRGQDLTLYITLVEAATENVLWKQTYNKTMTNLVVLQNDIARDVADNLKVKLSGADEQNLAKNYTADTEAYQFYLKGRYEWNKHTLANLQKSIEYYNLALEKDPNYALAYFGLTASYGVLGNTYLPPNEAYPKAKTYAAKALAIDDTLAEAHTSAGANKLYFDWDWAAAQREFKRAQTLDPNFGDAHQLYGDSLETTGRFDEALAERKRSLELDPLSPVFNMADGATLYFARRTDEAITQLEKTISLEPRYVDVYFYLGEAYEQKKMFAQAIAVYQKGIAQAERNPQLIAALGHAYALSGERDKATKSLDELREMSNRQYVSPYLFAVVYAGLGDKEQTFAWLEKAFQDRSFFLIWLKVEPQFDSLRDDSRFQDLLRRIGFSQ